MTYNKKNDKTHPSCQDIDMLTEIDVLIQQVSRLSTTKQMRSSFFSFTFFEGYFGAFN